MSRGVLTSDPLFRTTDIFHIDDGKVTIETREDAGPLVDAAKILAETPPRKEDGWRFLCVIPRSVFNRAATEGWLHDKAAWRAWMNNRDNRAFNGGREHVG